MTNDRERFKHVIANRFGESWTLTGSTTRKLRGLRCGYIAEYLN